MNKKKFVLLALVSCQCLSVVSYRDTISTQRGRAVDEERYRMEKRFRGEDENGETSANVSFIKGILIWAGWRY
jgi:hypothetical protein